MVCHSNLDHLGARMLEKLWAKTESYAVTPMTIRDAIARATVDRPDEPACAG